MDPLTASIAPQLYVYGPLGIGVFVLGLACARLLTALGDEKRDRLTDREAHAKEIDRIRSEHAKEMAAEHARALDDLKRFNELSLEIQAKSLDAAEQLRLAVDKVVGAADTIDRTRRSR